MNKATINICVQVLCEHKFSFLLGKHLGVGLLGQMVSVCLTLYKNSQDVFQIGCTRNV